MRVKFLVEDIREKLNRGLSENEKAYYDSWSILPSNFHLTYLKEYVVYAIEYDRQGFINFFIVDDTEVSYPKSFPSDFFEVTDNRLSKYWETDNEYIYPFQHVDYPKMFSFKEVISNDYFFDDLFENRKRVQDSFFSHKELLENEFPNLEISKAEIVDKNWVMCAYCQDVWEVNSENGIIKCSLNGHLNNNPLWGFEKHY